MMQASTYSCAFFTLQKPAEAGGEATEDARKPAVLEISARKRRHNNGSRRQTERRT